MPDATVTDVQSLIDRLTTVPADGEASPVLTGDDLTALDDTALTELHDGLVTAFDAGAADDDPDPSVLEPIAAAVDAVRVEQASRGEDATARAEAVAALAARVHAEPEASEPDPDDDDSDDDDEDEDEPEAEVVAIVTPAPEAVAAAADPVEPVTPPARPSVAAVAARTTKRHRPQTKPRLHSLVAAGDVPGFSAGQTMPFDAMGEAFQAKVEALAGPNTRPGKYPVALMRAPRETGRFLSRSASPEQNSAIMDAVAGPQALLAAGGWCGAQDPDHSVPTIGTADRPIKAALPHFPSDRGGIRFYPTMTLAAATGSVDVWSNDDDVSALDGSPTKSCLRIECPEDTTVLVDAITRCVEIGNFPRRGFPELFAAIWEQSGVAHARLGDTTLYNSMVAASIAVTDAKQLGTTRDLLVTVDRAVAAYRHRHRVGDGVNFTAILPTWAQYAMRSDLVRQIPGDDRMSVSLAELTGWFADRGVRLVFSLDIQVDEIGTSQGAGPLIGYPDKVEFLLYPEGAFTFLDAGTLDFGTEIRDVTSIRTNDVYAFMETFEGVAHRGLPSLFITADTCADGSTAATVTVDCEPQGS